MRVSACIILLLLAITTALVVGNICVQTFAACTARIERAVGEG